MSAVVLSVVVLAVAVIGLIVVVEGRGMLICVIVGFRREAAENCALLGDYAAIRANRYSLRNHA